MKALALSCRCGTLRGELRSEGMINRAVCYCRDCQTYAWALGQQARILDELAGTEVVATHPRNLTFSQGRDALACLSLTPRGLLRWYAGCCDTAVANTPRNQKIAYVGIVHTCLDTSSVAQALGAVTMRVNTRTARGAVPSVSGLDTLKSALQLVGSLMAARISGSYRRNPFFSSQLNVPLLAPRVLTREELQHARAAAMGTSTAAAR